MEGLALALQAEKARLNGMEPTPGSVRRAHTFFREADDFYEKLLAQTSPSPASTPSTSRGGAPSGSSAPR